MYMFHRIAGIIVSGSVTYWLLESSSSAISLSFTDTPGVLYLLRHLFKVLLDITLLYFLSIFWSLAWYMQHFWDGVKYKPAKQEHGYKTSDPDRKGGYENWLHSNCPSAQARNKNISKLICGLMLPFNAVSNKSFIKLMATTDACFSQALLWKIVLPLIQGDM